MKDNFFNLFYNYSKNVRQRFDRTIQLKKRNEEEEEKEEINNMQK